MAIAGSGGRDGFRLRAAALTGVQAGSRQHEPYLQRRGGARLRPESADEALAWATAPLHATSSLLIPAANGFLAFDYLIDAADKDRVPGEAIKVLISIATPSEALNPASWETTTSRPSSCGTA